MFVTKEMKMSQRQRCQQMLLHLVIKKLGHSIRPESTKNETLEADPGLGSRVTVGRVVHRKDADAQLKVVCGEERKQSREDSLLMCLQRNETL